MTKFKEWPDYANVDVLVGGTPCQSFSIAGLRKGLDDPRGNLMLTFGSIAAKYRPTWMVWENVYGVLSSNRGRDFASFLGLITGQRINVPDGGWQNSGIIPGYKNAYGVAYRVLDAQYVRTDGYPYAVPQRRRRVFVVGYIGSWQRAAAVLFDSESLRGNPPPRREAGKEVAGTIGARTGVSRGVQDCESGHIISATALAGNTIGRNPQNGGNGIGYDDTGSSYTLTKMDVHAVAYSFDSLSSNSMKSSNPNSGCNTVDVSKTLDTSRGLDPSCNQGGIAIAYRTNSAGQVMRQDGIAAALNTQTDPCAQILQSNMQVRRLTPRECERLQAFPDDYTNIPGASDTTRYKALGNSMAVNVMQLIGQRIQMVSDIPDPIHQERA
jgi:DNA (cytosine-5)-methyltransferase 1